MSFNQYRNSFRSDRNWKDGDFVLSSVNKKDMNRYGISMTVKEFKEMVAKSRMRRVILTGGVGGWRHTQVYNYNDFAKVR